MTEYHQEYHHHDWGPQDLHPELWKDGVSVGRPPYNNYPQQQGQPLHQLGHVEWL